MYLSRDEIEAIAKRVLRAYYRLPCLCGEPVKKVDPSILAESLLRLKVEYQTLSLSGSLLGMTAFGDVEIRIYDDNLRPTYYHTDEKTLFIDKYLLKDPKDAGRFHFTLMHEACHQIYRMLYPWNYAGEIRGRRVHYCRANRSPADWEEWRTDALAAAILMPPELVLSALESCGIHGKIEMLNRVFAPREYQQFAAAAEILGVSKTAFSIRLKQMGLIGRDDLKDPYALVDIHVEDGELNDCEGGR